MGAVASYMPWCASASRSSAVIPASSTLSGFTAVTRPGARTFTSWSSQPLPSGSVNDAYEKYERCSGSGPAARGAEPKNSPWW